LAVYVGARSDRALPIFQEPEEEAHENTGSIALLRSAEERAVVSELTAFS
jgi:hypothetical protein